MKGFLYSLVFLYPSSPFQSSQLTFFVVLPHYFIHTNMLSCDYSKVLKLIHLYSTPAYLLCPSYFFHPTPAYLLCLSSFCPSLLPSFCVPPPYALHSFLPVMSFLLLLYFPPAHLLHSFFALHSYPPATFLFLPSTPSHLLRTSFLFLPSTSSCQLCPFSFCLSLHRTCYTPSPFPF